MDTIAIKMDAHYKEMKSGTKCNICRGMTNYGKFLKELVRNKHKLEEISSSFLNDECLAIIQNKVPSKLRDPRSFLIPCTFSKTFSCNTLADLGASINLMPYSLYAKLSLDTLKVTKISVRLVKRSFQYSVGIAKNMLVEVAMKHSYFNDDTCLSIDVIDEILEEDFNALLEEGSKILYSIEGTPLEDELFAEFNDFAFLSPQGKLSYFSRRLFMKPTLISCLDSVTSSFEISLSKVLYQV
nr:reverse transcriptase domain-containing protein [Tanacetum cinerariifolium]